MSVIVESFEIFSVFEDSVTISLSVEPYDYRAGLVIWGVSGFGEAVAVIDVLLGQRRLDLQDLIGQLDHCCCGIRISKGAKCVKITQPIKLCNI